MFCETAYRQRAPKARCNAWTQRLLGGLAFALATVALAQPTPGEFGYAEEARDWGIGAIDTLRRPPFHAPTPLSIPGAQMIVTRQLQALLAGPDAPLLIDVLSERGHRTLAGAVWLPGAGEGTNFIDPAQVVLMQVLGRLTRGDHNKPMVFFCANAQCWLSYNAALRTAAAGYTRVYWYRGGIEAWTAAGLPTARTSAEQ